MHGILSLASLILGCKMSTCWQSNDLSEVLFLGVFDLKNNFCSWSSGFEIAPHGIMKPVKRHASLTGEAYVKFASKEIAEKALTRHNEYMGSR